MKKTLAAAILAGSLVAGCEFKPSVIPTTDTALDRTSAQYAADAVKHFPFRADLPKGQTEPARALVDYSLDNLDFTNLSKEDFTDVEIWINRQYVMALPILKAGDIKRLNFRMFYDDQGDHFPLNNNVEKGGVIIRQLQMIEKGKLYEVPVRQGL